MFNSVYLDMFSSEFVTLEQLEKEHEQLKRDGETESETFDDYLANCLYLNDGALYPVADCVVRNDCHVGIRLSFADCIYIMREQLHIEKSDVSEMCVAYTYKLNHITRPELIEIVNEYMNH